MTASDTSLALAAIANLSGVAIAIGLWRRSRRRAHAIRSRHPSVGPPLTLGLEDGDRGRALRVEARPGAPSLAVDIVSFRPALGDAPWDSLPLVDPIVIEPGGSALVDTPLPAGVDAVDVVIAWTAHHATADVQGSQLFRLPAVRETPTAPTASGVLGGRPTLALVVLLVASALLVGWSAVTGDDSAAPTGAAASSASPGPDPDSASPGATAPPTSPAPTAASVVEVAAPTGGPATTAEPETTPASVTVVASDDTDEPSERPEVLVEARLAPCRFGDECLIADFRIERFDVAPQEYVCEFDDGSRFAFRFDSDGVEEACATGNTDAAITIEIDGVRSDTVTRADAAPLP